MLTGVNETIKNEAKDQKGFFGMLLGTSAASLSGSMLASKGVIQASEGGWGTVIADQDF